MTIDEAWEKFWKGPWREENDYSVNGSKLCFHKVVTELLEEADRKGYERCLEHLRDDAWGEVKPGDIGKRKP